MLSILKVILIDLSSFQILSVKLMEMATTSILMNVVADSLAVEASEQI